MTVDAQKQTLGFQTEVKQLLHLMIHSLYSNKEIFLRELISNASDAIDKLRFEGLHNDKLYESDPNLKIVIDYDEQAKTISIRDNGIGMNRDEVTTNLGTIAKSGTKDFLAKLTGDQKKDAHLIGQFGVGFYSSFIVADKVTVLTRHAGDDKNLGVKWHSTGDGEYTLENIERENRGTEIILHLKKEEEALLNGFALRNIIKKYSDHISVPIDMRKMPEMNDEGQEIPSVEFETVNRAKALWTLSKQDVSDEEYQEFYKHVSHDYEDPLTWIHNRVEGKLEYTSLLYIPKHAPFDLWNREQRHGLKLYVQRVFIMDDAQQFLPFYLRFVKGVLDTKDLPLNISREILQNNKNVDSIKSALTKRVLDLLTKMAENEHDQYAIFWKQFGNALKEGPAEDFSNKEKIAKLLRFASTDSNTNTQTVSLDDYIARMKANQDKIYYITADSYTAAANSPHLEVFRKKGIEVLLLSDQIDEWLVSHLFDYDGKQLQSVAKGDLDLGQLEDETSKQELKQTEKSLEGFIKQVAQVLGEKVKEVKLTNRLTNSPACVVADEHDLGRHMQRILQAAGQDIAASKPILELNPEHMLIKTMQEEQDDERFANWTHVLFDQAILAEGGKLEDPATFVKRLNEMLLQLAK